MSEYKKIVQVIQILPDMDQVTGEQYTQVTLAFESSTIPQQMPTSPPVPYWKYSVYIFIPKSLWRDQYKMWKRYEMVVKDTGELELKPIEQNP